MNTTLTDVAPLMSDPAPGGPGLPAPASLGANAGSLSAARLATSGASPASFGWDGRGSATVRLDRSGSLAGSFSFGMAGAVEAGPDAGLSLHGWDGEEVSPGAGMVFLRARWLLAAEGVFASADLFLGAAGLPSTLNRYAFGLGDPVNRLDPTGHWSLADVVGRVRSAVDTYVPPAPSLVSRVAWTVRSVYSAVNAARAAGGSDWVVMQAGLVAAAIAARFCGSAAYMSKSAPKPSGTCQGVMTATGVIMSTHQGIADIASGLAEHYKFDDLKAYAQKASFRLGAIGTAIGGVSAHGSIQRYYDSHPELDEVRRSNNAAAQFDIRFVVSFASSYTFVFSPITEEILLDYVYNKRIFSGRSAEELICDFRWEIAGGKYGW